MIPKKASLLVPGVASVVLYLVVAYQINRTETTSLLICFAALFGMYTWIATRSAEEEIPFWVGAGIVFRACFLFAIPSLSDDFYRFLWDGHLLNAGYHPFAHVPSYYIDHSIAVDGITSDLFFQLNSPDYFTIYPPVNQFVFWLAARLGGTSEAWGTFVLHAVILLEEIGSTIFMRKIIRHHQLPASNVLLYALNPLVIIELTGNLHFEALMIFFLLGSYWFLVRSRWVLSALFFSLAICTKLLPVIFLPLFIVRLGWKRVFIHYVFILLFTFLFFLPLLNEEIIIGLRESIGYYFKKFEFNASIYYLVREWGFWKYGYNIIQTVGWKLALYAALFIFLYIGWDAWKTYRKNELHTLWLAYLVLLTIYFLFSTVVHPWYVCSLVAFSIFTTWRFAIVWSALIVITYIGYTPEGYSESLTWVAIEYFAVVLFAFTEWRVFSKFRTIKETLN